MLHPGDAVLINSGWGKLWEKDNARYMKSSPGIGVAAAQWNFAAVAGDNARMPNFIGHSPTAPLLSSSAPARSLRARADAAADPAVVGLNR